MSSASERRFYRERQRKYRANRGGTSQSQIWEDDLLAVVDAIAAARWEQGIPTGRTEVLKLLVRRELESPTLPQIERVRDLPRNSVGSFFQKHPARREGLVPLWRAPPEVEAPGSTKPLGPSAPRPTAACATHDRLSRVWRESFAKFSGDFWSFVQAVVTAAGRGELEPEPPTSTLAAMRLRSQVLADLLQHYTEAELERLLRGVSSTTAKT